MDSVQMVEIRASRDRCGDCVFLVDPKDGEGVTIFWYGLRDEFEYGNPEDGWCVQTVPVWLLDDLVTGEDCTVWMSDECPDPDFPRLRKRSPRSRQSRSVQELLARLAEHGSGDYLRPPRRGDRCES